MVYWPKVSSCWSSIQLANLSFLTDFAIDRHCLTGNENSKSHQLWNSQVEEGSHISHYFPTAALRFPTVAFSADIAR
ncbi:hypothetical protein LCGC14_1919070 [marine sediment metagenome]|uniref:Uncharacterized protein n=1 Tax=marine sediment metagenome TaxID=412755 RepID=A0A0F9FS54_9ZZZZ